MCRKTIIKWAKYVNRKFMEGEGQTASRYICKRILKPTSKLRNGKYNNNEHLVYIHEDDNSLRRE